MPEAGRNCIVSSGPEFVKLGPASCRALLELRQRNSAKHSGSRVLGRRSLGVRGVWLGKRRDNPDVQEAIVRGRVRTARVARLATTDPDGRPHLVPIVFVLDGQTLYSAVDAKPKRSRRLRRVANARERPDVTVLVDHYEDDWGRLWWVSLRGRARVLDTGEEAERALRLLADK